MIRYVFADRPLIINNRDRADPQEIGAELDRVRAAHEGVLKPEFLLEAARNRRNPLHKHFEWDDAKAANAYRLDQARHLITSVRPEGEEFNEAPAFVSITDKGGRSYRHITDVMGSAQLQKLVLEGALRDLTAFRNRYRRLASLFDPGISDAIERLAAATNTDRPSV